jgi:transposase
MNKVLSSQQATIFCGIDVSARSLVVALIGADQALAQREFGNSPGGHKELIVWLGKRGAKVRVSMEATGIYSLDVALALEGAAGIELAVLNPKLANRFAQTLRRSKTDAADAMVLAEYSQRMPFTAWQRPSVSALRLRSMGRHIESLIGEQVSVKNRLSAARSTASTPRAVIVDLERAQAALVRRLRKMRGEAMKLVEADRELVKRFKLLVSIPGIAAVSALQILSELQTLAPEMTVRQWVAYCGLDPVHEVSGTSVHKPSRISRAGNSHLRRALFMPTLSAVRFDPHIRSFHLALKQRHKTGLQALLAVERKLVHAIYGIFKSGKPYDGSLLFPHLEPALKSIAG